MQALLDINFYNNSKHYGINNIDKFSTRFGKIEYNGEIDCQLKGITYICKLPKDVVICEINL
jgi:hypothetical protein